MIEGYNVHLILIATQVLGTLIRNLQYHKDEHKNMTYLVFGWYKVVDDGHL